MSLAAGRRDGIGAGEQAGLRLGPPVSSCQHCTAAVTRVTPGCHLGQQRGGGLQGNRGGAPEACMPEDIPS